MSTSKGHDYNEPTTTDVEVFTVEMNNKEGFKLDSNGGIQLDPINYPSRSSESEGVADEENDVGAIGKPVATDTSGRLTSQSCVTFDAEPKNDLGPGIIRMASTDSFGISPKSPKSPKSLKSSKHPLARRHSRVLTRKITALLRRDSNLPVHHVWRQRNATVREKSSKNFVSFHNICYTLPQGYFWQCKPPKVILNNVR